VRSAPSLLVWASAQVEGLATETSPWTWTSIFPEILGYSSLGWNRISWLIDRGGVDGGSTGWGCSRVTRCWLVGGSRNGNGSRSGAVGIGLCPRSALVLLALEESLELVHCVEGCGLRYRN